MTRLAREYIEATPLRERHPTGASAPTGFSKDQVDESTERLQSNAVERIDAAVANGWLAGDAISLADFCVLPTIVRMSDIGLENIWAGLPQFVRWYDRMRARPSFERAFYPGSTGRNAREANRMRRCFLTGLIIWLVATIVLRFTASTFCIPQPRRDPR